MKKVNLGNWRKFGFEFLSIFIAVISAFALNNWNDNRKDRLTENKILTEISQGLEKDLSDIRENVSGHDEGIAAVFYFIKILNQDSVPTDSLMLHYFNLTRDYISIQNVAGYESLKSKGLELIQNDALRNSVVSLYEYDYQTLRKLEEEYTEMQFHEVYYNKLNSFITKNLRFNDKGIAVDINSPFNLTQTEHTEFMMILWKILSNRHFIMGMYNEIEETVIELQKQIGQELKE